MIQEVRILIIEEADYRKEEWTLIWSSASIANNVTIGIPKYDGSDYKLILTDKGNLNLYDAVGTLILCTGIECKHRFGYKFPEVYLVPTKIITEEVSTDPHNRINKKIRLSSIENSMKSLDTSCSDYLPINTALVSNNTRFKLYLEENGNLIIKDGHRTIWDSSSANLPYAVSPYKLILSPTGNLMILSSNDYLIWYTYTSLVRNFTRPFKVSLLDEGRMVITDKNNTELWESWPGFRMSNSLTVLNPIEYHYVPCHGEALISKKYLESGVNISI